MVHRIDALGSVARPAATPHAPARPEAAPGAFAAVLRDTIEAPRPLRFSAHAETRLAQRGIELSPDDHARLAAAADQAAGKGGRDTLILMNNVAFVVNVPNRTVVTAAPAADARSTVFTQIDSVVLTPPVENESEPNEANRPDPLAGGRAAADRLMRRL